MPDFTIEPRSSVRLRAGLVALHLLAVMAAWGCDLPLPLLLLLTSGIAISLIRVLCRPGGRIRRMERYGEQWSLFSESGTIREASLSHWFVHPRLLILAFSIGRWHRTIVALPDDAADADDLRRLRRYLLDRQRMDEIGQQSPGA